MRVTSLASGLSLVLFASPILAQTFSDSFDSNSGGLNSVPIGWTVTDGTVDLIPVGSQYNFLPNNGTYVDLDGSTRNPGLLSKALVLTANVQYVARFDLAGNNVGSGQYGADTVVVTFGTQTATITRQWNDPFQQFSLTFTPSSTGGYVLSFQNDGSNNVGALLDRVSVVPEPEAYGLALAGFGVLALAKRRRQRPY